MSKEVSNLVQRRDELTVMAKMIDDGSHAGSLLPPPRDLRRAATARALTLANAIV